MLLFSFMLKAQEKNSFNLPDTTTVFVKGGIFYMGDTPEQELYDDNKPVHEVHLDGYYIGKYAVTVSDFAKFVSDPEYEKYKIDLAKYEYSLNSWKQNINGEPYEDLDNNKYPAIVSLEEANAYCDWLSKKTKNTYRLPTEAEWEYAARGGLLSEGYKYSGSNNIDSVAWYSNDDTQESNIQPVGLKKANELGIYDMSGNVWEYCSDYYKESYTAYTQKNPTGPKKEDLNTGEDLRIIIRGGSFKHSAIGCQVSYRGWQKMGTIFNTGFRIVRVKKHEK